MEMRSHPRVVDDLDKTGIDLMRPDRGDAQALDGRLVQDPLQHISQAKGPVADRPLVRPDVRSGQDDFPVALFDRLPDLPDDLIRRDITRGPSCSGDDAVGAMRPAALLDLDHPPGPRLPLRDVAHVQVKRLVDPANPDQDVIDDRQLIDRTGDEVDLGHFLEIFRRHGRVTANGRDQRRRVLPARAAKHLAGSPVGEMRDGAGIDDIDVGIVTEFDFDHAGLAKSSTNVLFIALIQLATKGADCETRSAAERLGLLRRQRGGVHRSLHKARINQWAQYT
ncbi:hypothetical protein NITHO_2170008 [Nitrolancea hollandica Lb]|uniref:Uncharacterized protein n=1 Tax=Nitrolancea hollandica Lb TaxID=1129897 RepID=I4EF18_9BACT|nr:hypothetical protein NITHO_2170008 [Nitrolancea hollandica Lb]